MKVVMEYHPGQNIYFDCYVEGPEVKNTHDDITSMYVVSPKHSNVHY